MFVLLVKLRNTLTLGHTRASWSWEGRRGMGNQGQSLCLHCQPVLSRGWSPQLPGNVLGHPRRA